MKDLSDLADTLAVLCDVKREANHKKTDDNVKKPQVRPEPMNVTNTAAARASAKAHQPPKEQEAASGMSKISLMKFGAAPANPPPPPPQAEPEPPKNQHKHSAPEEEEENLQIEDNPDESGDNEDINSIIQYQHKILGKYTMMGLIQYADAPFFHDMVDQRDYKMISVFEVFAINRNEDDFLENLDLFKQLVMEQEDPAANEEQKEAEEELKNPKLAVLYEFRESLTEEEFQWCRQEVKNTTKNIINIIECFLIMKDTNDLVHSLKQLYKRANK